VGELQGLLGAQVGRRFLGPALHQGEAHVHQLGIERGTSQPSAPAAISSRRWAVLPSSLTTSSTLRPPCGSERACRQVSAVSVPLPDAGPHRIRTGA